MQDNCYLLSLLQLFPIIICDFFLTGSPYELEVGVSHKKGEVMVSGPGLENGILHHYNSNFLVNTTNAGSGELKVSIMGPRGT